MKPDLEKKICIGLCLILAAAMGAVGVLVQIPDREMEDTLGTCVPVYYSGLECCKSGGN